MLKVFYKFQFLFLLKRQWIIKMTSNNSIVWKFFSVKATDAKKVICNLYSNEFLRGSDEKVFSFDFNVRAVFF